MGDKEGNRKFRKLRLHENGTFYIKKIIQKPNDVHYELRNSTRN